MGRHSAPPPDEPVAPDEPVEPARPVEPVEPPTGPARREVAVLALVGGLTAAGVTWWASGEAWVVVLAGLGVAAVVAAAGAVAANQRRA